MMSEPLLFQSLTLQRVRNDPATRVRAEGTQWRRSPATRSIADYETVRNQLWTDIFVLHYMPLTGPMSNLVSSTELLEIGTFCYRLNTTSCKTWN